MCKDTGEGDRSCSSWERHLRTRSRASDNLSPRLDDVRQRWLLLSSWVLLLLLLLDNVDDDDSIGKRRQVLL